MTERGFLSPTLLIYGGAAIAAAVAVAAGLAWLAGWKEDLRNEGRNEIRLEVATRDNDALEAAAREIAALQADIRAQEATRAQAVARIDQTGQKRLREAQNEADTLRSQLAAGVVVLRDPNQPAACPATGDRGAGGETGPGPGVDHGAEKAELPRATAEFLRGLAAEADSAVIALTACQDVLRADRAGVE